MQLSAPMNAAILSPSESFVRTPDGGCDDVFAVDLALSPGFAPYYSTYEHLHTLIHETSWTLPMPVWNRVPVGKKFYWRVRGADLDDPPLNDRLRQSQAEILPSEADPAFTASQQAGKGVQGCRLASAIRPDQRDNLTFIDVKIDPLKGVNGAIVDV